MSSNGPVRLLAGGTIDRTRRIAFRFDGRACKGFEGDSLAAGLLANGVRVVARSLKFRRPRGVYSCGVEEPNALVQIGSGAAAVPSERSTLVELHDGLEAFSQSGWPSASTDAGRMLDLLAPLWAAGFYNKAFFWPSWDCYEWLFRRLSGLGRAPTGRDPDRYEADNLHCDVLVIGGGVAGISAAVAASDAGGRIVLVDQGTVLGGHAAWDGTVVDGVPGMLWIQKMAERLRQATARVLTRTVALGYHDHNVVSLIETCVNDPSERARIRQRYWLIRAKRVVIATGAIEQPLIFDNNDRPGVMLAGAAHQYLHRYGVAIGRRVVVATNNDSAYAVARDLTKAGIVVAAILDTRHEHPTELSTEAQALSIPVLTGAVPIDTMGFSKLRCVSVGRLSKNSRDVTTTHRVECDAVLISGGWNPALQLYSQSGAKLAYCEDTGALGPVDELGPMLVGAARGIAAPDLSVRHAAQVGRQAATEAVGGPEVNRASRQRGTESSVRGEVEPVLPKLSLVKHGIRVSPVGVTRRQWVDLRHDVTVADLEQAVRENYTSIEHVKRYTTLGMSVDQGKTSNAVGIEIVARLSRVPHAEVGHTTLRPPFTPVTLGAMAGRDIGDLYAPWRQLPTHNWQMANGATLEDFGEWKRPAVYQRDSESRSEAVSREARNVRTAAGLMDGSSLGKIEVHGLDARNFLDRFYINNLLTLQSHRARYGFMLRESGVIFDDGTVVMLKPDHFLITTTSGNSGRVAEWLEEWKQCEWPHLRVTIIPVTEQWATLTVTGPNSRSILSLLSTDIDFQDASFPHLAVREGVLLGRRVRIYRVSFTGELTYEINVPASAAQMFWDAVLEAGAPLGLQPFGIDALSLMRLEKGYILVGSDTDGSTVPADIGWGKTAASKEREFIGKRSLRMPQNVRSNRPQLVGLVGLDDQNIAVGSHLLLSDSKQTADGWVTSAGRAVLTGGSIALAMLEGGRDRLGEVVSVCDLGRVSRARVTTLPFLDPSGARQNG